MSHILISFRRQVLTRSFAR